MACFRLEPLSMQNRKEKFRYSEVGLTILVLILTFISLWILPVNSFSVTATSKQNKLIDEKYNFINKKSIFSPRFSPGYFNNYEKKDINDYLVQAISNYKNLSKSQIRPHVEKILELTSRYQIDPIWAISVVISESAFKTNAVSPKDAVGLMQIQVPTARMLLTLMGRKYRKSDEQLKKDLMKPQFNIELGVYYLKHLLVSFHQDYHLASVAYNYGPYKLKDRIRSKEIILSKVEYLRSIQTHYQHLVVHLREPGVQQLLAFSMRRN